MKKRTSKEIEKERYNTFSLNKLKNKSQNITSIAPYCISVLYRQPYLYYHELLKSISVKQKGKHLDLCCGDGIHSFTTSPQMNVMALDYSAKSIELAKLKNKVLMKTVEFKVADVENLKFEDESFDLVTIVGSLSYLDKNRLMNEISRVLKPGGNFVCVDSLNNNPIYRLNRYIHFLRGNRSFSTLKRMPNLNFIKLMNQQFTDTKVKFFGKILFLGIFLKNILGIETTLKLSNHIDKKNKFNSLAFKFVFSGKKPI